MHVLPPAEQICHNTLRRCCHLRNSDKTIQSGPVDITSKYNWSDEDTDKFVQSVNNDKLILRDNDLDMLLKVDNIDSENVGSD